MLNRRGGIQCDLTVTRLSPERYRIVTGTASGSLDLAWIVGQLDDAEGVEVRDVTSSLACLGLWGPRARDILTSVCADDLSNEGFPFMTSREITVGDVPCRALRVTYVGELGWELYAPVGVRRDAVGHADRGRRAARHGPGRLPRDRLAAAREGLPGVGRGRDARRLAARGRARVRRRGGQGLRRAGRRSSACAPRARDASSSAWCWRTRAPRRSATNRCAPSGEVVARVTSGGIGYTVGASIAYAYLPTELAVTGTAVEVEVFGEWIGAEVADEPLYDPKGERVRA